MALYDWNHNGKKDWQDNYIEYQVYKDVTGQKDNSAYTPSNGISTVGAILCMVGGLFSSTGIVSLLSGGNTEGVPVIITIILWIICAASLASIFDHHGI